jgi:NAD(P)-dependent dehydrogenase (short-subunit alcohol dehydrogenase family)
MEETVNAGRHTPGRKAAIVTAAGKGMGAACARELATRGYSPALMSRSEEATDLARELGGVSLEGSVTEEADLRTLVDKTLEAYGRVDAVVNSTGHPPTGDILDITDEEWHAGLDLVLLNVVKMARLVTPIMVRQGEGAMVNISTFSAFEPSAAFPVSSCLRSALAGFTKLYADRYAADGIRMNNVLPGFVESFEVDEQTRASIPMQRPGTVEEIAKCVAFLVSSDASYITGQNLRVDGGLTRSV